MLILPQFYSLEKEDTCRVGILHDKVKISYMQKHMSNSRHTY